MGRKSFGRDWTGFTTRPKPGTGKAPCRSRDTWKTLFDYPAVREEVLHPLGPEGNRWYSPEIFDHQKGESVKPVPREASVGSILLFEGVMLFRKVLIDFFDFRILVICSEKVILERAKVRDLAHFGDLKTLLEKYEQRFVPGQKKNTLRKTNLLRMRTFSFLTTIRNSQSFLCQTERENDFLP